MPKLKGIGLIILPKNATQINVTNEYCYILNLNKEESEIFKLKFTKFKIATFTFILPLSVPY